jgi:hypothetical protein
MCLTIDPVVLICEVRWCWVLVSFAAVQVFGYCSSMTSLLLVYVGDAKSTTSSVHVSGDEYEYRLDMNVHSWIP